jgi:hypothetical protein
MRSGSRLGGPMAGAMVALLTVATAGDGAALDRVRPVPLGGSLSGQDGDRSFGVYVPTRFGGQLTIKASVGAVGAITGPDGRTRANGAEVGANQHGWYTFRVTGAEKPYTVETQFVQVGQAARQPWNFYYWPTKSDAIHEPWGGGNGRVDTMGTYGDDVLVASPGGYIAPGQDIVRAGPNGLLETPVAPGDDSTWFPNLYDDLTWRGADGTNYWTPAPMLKYDQLFNSAARNWEAANAQNQDIQRWPGHCLGGAVASILLNEPTPAPGSGLSRDELKALWAELGENHYNHRIGDYATDIPAGPPRPGLDPCDRWVPRVHAMLETHLRGRRQALLANLRAFPPNGTVQEVWNHGVGKYVATYHAIPGRGERSVRLEVQLFANSGSNLNNGDNKPRVITYEYALVYGLDGGVDETKAWESDWIAVRGEALFAPLNVLELAGSRWAGHNPYITEENVRALDQANGGGYRFAGAAPTFSPVGSYEAGRRPIFALGDGGPFGGGSGAAAAAGPYAPTPRRPGFGLFRIFGR